MLYKITEWISDEEIESIPTSQYWNDKEVETRKMWSIPNNDFSAFEKYYKKIRTKSKFFPHWQYLFPPSKEKGDIHYSNIQYRRIFSNNSFKHKQYIFKNIMNQAFLLDVI